MPGDTFGELIDDIMREYRIWDRHGVQAKEVNEKAGQILGKLWMAYTDISIEEGTPISIRDFITSTEFILDSMAEAESNANKRIWGDWLSQIQFLEDEHTQLE